MDVDELRAEDPRGVARALSTVERGGQRAAELLRGLNGRLGRARTVGLTGPPGVGKSTLAQALGLALIRRGERVGVLAVDPTSPFSGGALLGDRLRMPDLLAAGGYVRSMATRGSPGGLAVAVSDGVDVLDAAGFGWVLVETVGAGQDEVDVAGEVETVRVVTVGGLGDEIQAAKAGLMEIADAFVVNKGDMPGADAQAAAIEAMLGHGPAAAWAPPVIRAAATTGAGVEEVLEAVLDHQRFLDREGRREGLRRRRARRRIERVLAALIRERLQSSHGDALARALDDVGNGTIDPYMAAQRLLARFLKEGA